MSFYENKEIVIDVWGDFACFTRPESKVERTSYPLPNPSAARGILNAIYSKPIEFYYQITKIEIINPIKTISIKKNEFKEKIDAKTLSPTYNINEKGNHGLTQRTTIYLKDVYYRIYAKIIKQKDFKGSLVQLYEQFEKRVKNGKCFYQPSLGLRECMCNFSMVDETKHPLDINLDLGIILYDVFDIRKNIPLDTSKKDCNIINRSCFYAKVEHGEMIVPDYESDKVFKLEGQDV